MMIQYLYKTILIYGSGRSYKEEIAGGIILLAIFILTAWLDPV